MNLIGMRNIVRRDLHDEDADNYRWTDDEIDRHLAHAVKDYSGSVPLEQKAVISTVTGSREIDISTITNRVMIEAIEYPVDRFPKHYQRFSVWSDTVSLLGGEIPDGSDCHIYYGKLHTLDALNSTVPVWHEDLISLGACAYAVLEQAVYTTNKVNTGGVQTQNNFQVLGETKLNSFKQELKHLNRKNRVRIKSLYRPVYEMVNRSTDSGPS